MKAKIKKMPVFECDVSEDGQTWFFVCPWCQAKHHHGPYAGHRVSHCSIRNEENKNGYFIKTKDS